MRCPKCGQNVNAGPPVIGWIGDSITNYGSQESTNGHLYQFRKLYEQKARVENIGFGGWTTEMTRAWMEEEDEPLVKFISPPFINHNCEDELSTEKATNEIVNMMQDKAETDGTLHAHTAKPAQYTFFIRFGSNDATTVPVQNDSYTPQPDLFATKEESDAYEWKTYGAYNQSVAPFRFKQNLRWIVQYLKDTYVDVDIILGTPPPVSRKMLLLKSLKYNPEQKPYNAQINRSWEQAEYFADLVKKVATELGCSVIDFFSYFAQRVGEVEKHETFPYRDSLPNGEDPLNQLPQATPEFQKLFNDGLHLTEDGESVGFECIMEFVGKEYPRLKLDNFATSYPEPLSPRERPTVKLAIEQARSVYNTPISGTEEELAEAEEFATRFQSRPVFSKA